MSEFESSARVLQTRLRGVLRRLWARRLLRACVSGAIAAGAAGLIAVALLVALPLALSIAFEPAHWVAIAVSGVALVVGVARKLAVTRAPTLHDAALSLEARLEHGNGSLATALELSDSRFLKPVLAHASSDLSAALAKPAPHVLDIRPTILAPAVLLAATTALVWAFSLEATGAPGGGHAQSPVTTAFSVDVPSGRSAEDRAMLARALGLQKAAETMRKAAEAMRSESALPDQRQAALEEARKSAAESGDAELVLGGSELPEIAPSDDAEREALASRLESLAMGAGQRAEGSGGTTDTGRDGVQTAEGAGPGFVPFPRFSLRASQPEGAELTAQTPERRALAQRAMNELERQ